MQTYKIELTEGTPLFEIWDNTFGEKFDIFIEWGADRGHFQLTDSGAFDDVIDFDFGEYGHEEEFIKVMKSIGLELEADTDNRVMVIYAEIQDPDYDIAVELDTPDFQGYLHAFIYKLYTAVKILEEFAFPELVGLHDKENTVEPCGSFSKDETESILERVEQRANDLNIGPGLSIPMLDELIPPANIPASSRPTKKTRTFTAVPVN